MNSFDLIVFRWLNSLVFWKDWIDMWIIFKAEFLGWWILVGAALIVIFQRQNISLIRANRRMVMEALFAGILSRFVFTEVIRFFYNRPRPFEVLENINQLLAHSPGNSFPSGNASFFFAIASSVFFFHRVWGIIFFGMALYMGIGRIEVGIHWPTDILMGMAVGIFSAWIVKILFARYKTPS